MTSTISRIVAAVDGSALSLQAAQWAADEAAQRHRPIRLVHAVETDTLTYGAGVPLPQSYFDAVRADGVQILSDAREAVLLRHPELDVTVTLHTSGPVPALLEESDAAALLVLGAHGRGGVDALLLGSCVVAVAEHARCPVAVVRGRGVDGAPPTAGPVVVGVDGSPVSDAAVAAAFDEASWRHTELRAVHAWTEPFLPGTDRWVGREARTVAEEEVLAERLAGWQEKYPDVPVRRIVDRGHTVRSLLEHAEPAQLLVVGSRGRGGFTGLLLGSTSQSLVHHATCPVLIVRPTPGAS
ncbi:universal stress protein [Pseudonocardia abyssalis]|uniref:Universal stress protein n=1 Tax=Pseudonocardia abyssalis TaxID=2792008 RepID=A0ABS6UPQ7_9PSEU|nr:universal stress protein [Pseudonocardia abyssalis]MBW0116032.1 universal stress protein [Pseudonocardia abyssalis]MBW0133888.1 universal stress protein [Pseudonocardia abyssalis]